MISNVRQFYSSMEKVAGYQRDNSVPTTNKIEVRFFTRRKRPLEIEEILLNKSVSSCLDHNFTVI